MPRFNIVKEEEKVLDFWKKNEIFKKSVSARLKSKPFVFFEGPPTANAKPGIHHVIGRAYKDIILRYKTMRGFWAWRRAGWDTHGLPVEIEVEKELGLKNKKDIEKYGVAKFNAKCRDSVWRYKKNWEELTERMGFWIDMDDPYITYETDYIENLWAVLKKFWDKKLLFEDFKVLPYCVRCGTPISSHEVAQGYETVEDRSVYVKFRIRNPETKNLEPNTYLLAWTTTPWTLPGNVALAVGKDIEYVIVGIKNQESGIREQYILAKDRLEILDGEYEIDKEMTGKELVGLEYEPLFEVPELSSKKSYRVYAADFVSTEEGTGIVHTAAMYGVDDFDLGTKMGLPKVHTIREDGTFIKSVPVVGGRGVVKDRAKDPETEELIINHLKKNGLLLKDEGHKHEYPFCWRCHTPLLYYARQSWFVGASSKRDRLLANNKKINWIPEHIKEGRFGEWLRKTRDWAISRERYWGTPLPIWRCQNNECGHTEAVGSLEELNQKRAGDATTLILMRHGEARSNVERYISSWPEPKDNNLTEKGKKEVQKAAKKLKKEGIDAIYSSDLARTKETAKIVAEALGGVEIHYEKCLREIDAGSVNGMGIADYHHYMDALELHRKEGAENIETFEELYQRMFSTVRNIARKHPGKTILVVSHGAPLISVELAFSREEFESSEYREKRLSPGEFRKVEFPNWPFNEKGELDLHRPYVDDVVLACQKCEGEMSRIPELADAWFDSGAMPFAQSSFAKATEDKPGPQKRLGEPLKGQFPADYITEGVDQTRGWFYTLHAISTLLDKGPAYHNVITYGHVLDKKGKKMSKSLDNAVDPSDVIDRYGIDSLRWYFFTVNAPGEPKLFDIDEVEERHRKFVMRVINSLVFLETYWSRDMVETKGEKHVLDQWICSILASVRDIVTEALDNYDIVSAARALDDFVQELSNWYIRRSRDRLQDPDSTPAKAAVQQTLWETLMSLAKLLAPFTPFVAEMLFSRLASLKKVERESVHLTDWPETRKLSGDENNLIYAMDKARDLASLALAQRAEAGIKVRQPLSSLSVSTDYEHILLLTSQIIADEVNVKKISFNRSLSVDEVHLDTKITPELEREGVLREIIRAANDLRKKADLTPEDRIELRLRAEKPNGTVDDFSDVEEILKKETRADRVIEGGDKEFEERGWKISIGIKKL